MANSSSSLKSVERSFRILEFVRDNEPVSLTTVSDALELSKSTIHRHLSTLVSAGYLIREDGQYRVSFEFLSYANQIHLRDPSYPKIKRKVRELADESEELVQFTTNEERRLVYLFKETGRNGLLSQSDARTFRPLHSTAGGRPSSRRGHARKSRRTSTRTASKRSPSRRSPVPTRSSSGSSKSGNEATRPTRRRPSRGWERFRFRSRTRTTT
ncbi:DNA-binding transcriptional regulator KdgR [Halolamina pelagica]|uniref:DNA-binding transcriptional regulator KdgR n=1 Tax=Halolamina pelagica TaxID=699431 RepID=A0A0P7GKV6_9EURY|nr:DNA-binding transcriptional regulator KdgR [Halolamina pelagica]